MRASGRRRVLDGPAEARHRALLAERPRRPRRALRTGRRREVASRGRLGPEPALGGPGREHPGARRGCGSAAGERARGPDRRAPVHRPRVLPLAPARRSPQFGEARAGDVPAGLSSTSGTRTSSPPSRPAATSRSSLSTSRRRSPPGSRRTSCCCSGGSVCPRSCRPRTRTAGSWRRSGWRRWPRALPRTGAARSSATARTHRPAQSAAERGLRYVHEQHSEGQLLTRWDRVFASVSASGFVRRGRGADAGGRDADTEHRSADTPPGERRRARDEEREIAGSPR